MHPSIRRGSVMILLGTAVVGGLAYAFRPQPVAVDLATIERGDLVVTVDGEGRTRAREVYTVSSPLPGRITRIELRPGDPVQAGHTILTFLEETAPAFLDARSRAQVRAELGRAEAALLLARAEADRAQAELDYARGDLRRMETLHQRGALTEQALDQARLAVRTREAELATREAALRVRRFEVETARAALIGPGEDPPTEAIGGGCCIPVRSPVDGKVLRLLRESEAVVQAGEALIEIGDPLDLEVIVDLPSSEAVRVSEGAAVIIEAWGGEATLSGRVRRVEPFGFTKVSALGIEEQRVNVVIDLLDPPQARARLGHGFRVLGRMVVYEAEDVPLVPTGALFREGGEWAVFVSEGGTARRRTIARGPSDGRWAEVRGGLEPGEEVIVHPGERVAEGIALVPRN
jgi:HlyD family secretion protein